MESAEIRRESFNNIVLTTKEACDYLRISRPTFLKYLTMGRIRGIKAGKGWKVLKSELDRFLKGENNRGSSELDGGYI